MIVWLIVAYFWSGAALGDENAPPLFSSQQPLAITLVADFDKLLFRKRWSGDRWYEGRVELRDRDGADRSLPVRLKPRGGFRTRDDTCYFPQLFVDFSLANTEGTVFAGQRILPLTTHCRGASIYSGYVYREHMAYQLYNLFTEKSLRSRAALITYVRKDKPVTVAKRYAFFVEHFDSLAARLNAEIVEIEAFHPLSADAFQMGVLDMFQFMVGNTDWSAAFQHNILLLQEDDEAIVAVPYDFDFSGLVNARYAVPAKQFHTRSVRTRIYRGYCREANEVQEVVAYFQAKRPEVFSRIREFDWMPQSVLDDATNYLGSFYELLDMPEKFTEQVLQACGHGRPVPAN